MAMREEWGVGGLGLCLECGSGGCEFCSCHLPKRAVELLQGGAIVYGLANFIPIDLL